MPKAKKKSKTKSTRTARKRIQTSLAQVEAKGLLEIEFSGLCALVLNKKDPKRATEARILLLAGEKVLGFSSKEMKTEGRRWSPRLCASRLNLADTTAADETIETYGGEQTALWYVDGPSLMTIENDAGNPLVVSWGRRKQGLTDWRNSSPSAEEPPEDLSWLPEMERIVAGAGKLKKDLWDGWGDALVAGKVILTSGLIESIQPSKRRYTFKTKDDRTIKATYRHCFANGIRVRIWLKQPKATIKLTSPDRFIELVERVEHEPIRVSVTNHSGTSEYEHTTNSDPHFSAFYDLSNKPIPHAERLIPVEDGGVVHSKLRPCMGVELYDE